MENEETTVTRERKHFVRDLICNVDVSNAQFRSKTAVLVVLFAVLCQPAAAIVV